MQGEQLVGWEGREIVIPPLLQDSVAVQAKTDHLGEIGVTGFGQGAFKQL